MKKITFYLFILFFSSCNTEKKEMTNNNYSLTTLVKGAKENSIVFLKKQENGMSIKLDSAILKNGKVEFNGSIDLPQVYGVFIENQGVFPIVEKGNIKITTHIDSLYNAKITGTKLNNQLNDYKNKARKISEKMNASFHEFQKARAENDIEKISQINKRLKSINLELTNYKLDFVKNNPNSFVASMVLFSLAQNKDISKSKIQNLFNTFSEDVKKSEFSRNIESILESSIILKDSIN